MQRDQIVLGELQCLLARLKAYVDNLQHQKYDPNRAEKHKNNRIVPHNFSSSILNLVLKAAATKREPKVHGGIPKS